MSTYAEYDAIAAHRWSHIKHMNDGPRSYRAHMEQAEKDDSDAMAFGRAVHVAVFEPDMLPLQFSVWRGGTRRGPEWTAFLAAIGTSEPIREVDYLRALKVRDAVRSHDEAQRLLSGKGESEKTITWTDPETGLPCKARFDRLSLGRHPSEVDLKTVSKPLGDLHRFRYQAADLLYHGQRGMYHDGATVALDMDLASHMVVVETSGAFEVAVLKVSSNELWAGSDLFHELLGRIAECEASGVWPFRYEEVQEFGLPAWALPDNNEYSDTIEVLS